VLRSIKVGPKTNAVAFIANKFGEGEGLEAAAVGDDWSVPVHEPVEATERLDRLNPRSKKEVVRVRKDQPTRQITQPDASE
jgi:hypothetical protein